MEVEEPESSSVPELPTVVSVDSSSYGLPVEVADEMGGEEDKEKLLSPATPQLLEGDLPVLPEKKAVTAVPWKKVIVLLLCMLTEALSLTQLFPYVAFMVEDFGVAKDAKEVGMYAGFIASAFSLAQFFSSFFWGYASDLFGRRPVMLVGMAGTTLFTVLFGFSQTLWWAISVRALAGLMNGNIGVAKTYLGEITDATNRAKVFSVMGFIWGGGLVIGPLFGGFLSRPVIQYPFLFPDGAWWTAALTMFPYILPNLVAASISFTGLIGGVFFLKESRRKKKEKNQQSSTRKGSKSTSGGGSSGASYSVLATQEDADSDLEEAATTIPMQSIALGDEDRTETTISPVESEGVDSVITEVIALEMDGGKMDPAGSVALTGDAQEDEACKAEENANANENENENENEKKRSRLDTIRMLCSPLILTAVAMYALTALMYILYDETLSVWAMTPIELGGLSLGTGMIGIALGASGIGLLAFQPFFAKLCKSLGLLLVFRTGCILAAFFLSCLPFLNFLARRGVPEPILIMLLVCLALIRSVHSVMTFTSSVMMVNMSAPPGALGTVNGLGQSASSLFRAIGPTLGGWIFSLSLVLGLPFPFDFHFVFFFAGSIGLGIFCLTFLISQKQLEENEAAADAKTMADDEADLLALESEKMNGDDISPVEVEV
jgi:MFS family permease